MILTFFKKQYLGEKLVECNNLTNLQSFEKRNYLLKRIVKEANTFIRACVIKKHVQIAKLGIY